MPMKAQSSARASGPAAANEPVVLREDIGNIAVLTLNRPQARNSLSEAMLAALSQELESLATEKRIRAVRAACGIGVQRPRTFFTCLQSSSSVAVVEGDGCQWR